MNSQKPNKKIAVVGGGWAGAAAAVTLVKAGHEVCWIESSRCLGGRARAVEIHNKTLDNGQHILLGAYTACIGLFKTLNIDLQQHLLRLPLQMVYPKNSGMEFVAPKLPAPIHLAVALFKAKGLHRADKMALARFSTTARWMDWQLNVDCSVTELLHRYEQTDRLIQLMWNPLCVAALNTPPERASARVFLAVLRDSLGASRHASDMLLPKSDLSTLLPNAARRFIEKNGGQVKMGCAVHGLRKTSNQQWKINCQRSSDLDGQAFEGIVLATPAETSKRLFDSIKNDIDRSEATAVSPTIFPQEFAYEAITTCYLQYEETVTLDRPFYALLDDPKQSQWGQFVFDRGQLNSAHRGLLAVVVSAADNALALDHKQLATDIAMQLASQFQMPQLRKPIWQQAISEKRATFSCTPNLQRPSNHTSYLGLVLAGDYTACDYPATLESAVRSGISAAQLLTSPFSK